MAKEVAFSFTEQDVQNAVVGDTSRRRAILGGAAVISAVPLTKLRALMPVTPVETLTKLAAEGKFASGALHIPEDVFSADFLFYLNGELFPHPTKEVYAPSDGEGWIVYYDADDSDGKNLLRTALAIGKVRIERV